MYLIVSTVYLLRVTVWLHALVLIQFAENDFPPLEVLCDWETPAILLPGLLNYM